MESDLKREMLRHLVATLAFRADVALSNAGPEFAAFKFEGVTRTPAEILAHMADLLQGSLVLMQGQFVTLNSVPLPWQDEVKRFFSASRDFDLFLGSDAPLGQAVEKIMQGPIADALTHVGQLVMLRRAAGMAIRSEGYFAADVVPGRVERAVLDL